MPSISLRNSLSLLALVACGAPSPLDIERFPAPSDTGYAGTPNSSVGFASTGGAAGAPNDVGGSGGSGTGGSAFPGGGGVVASGGTGMDVGVAGAATGVAGAGMDTGTAGTDVAGPPVVDACDALPLFQREGPDGGCNGALFCHGPNQTPPDLVSEGVAERLLQGVSVCDTPYLSGGQSLIIEKLGDAPSCGQPMPFDGEVPDADRDCMIDWFNAVIAGG